MYRIKKGLDLRLDGVPVESIDDRKSVGTVGVTGPDYIGMRPSMLVKEGDLVEAGQPLFSCKKNEGVIYTSPGSGKIKAINRGDRRVLQSVWIELDGKDQCADFNSFEDQAITRWSEDSIRALLIESGLWTAFRTRPYSKVPTINSQPTSIFITAMDTNPLSVDPEFIIKFHDQDFYKGLEIVSKLADKSFVSVKNETTLSIPRVEKLELKKFSGIHPAGNVGTHIHLVDPVSENKTVWHIGYQDVIAIGKLFDSGKLWTDRYVAIGGTGVKNPRVVKTNQGACLITLLTDELKEGNFRAISGSVFSGRTVSLDDRLCCLGRYHNQVSVIPEGGEREMFGWIAPGLTKFSVKNVLLSRLLPKKSFSLTSNQNGSFRAIVPIGSYEKVMPLDILPTPLLKALASKDTDLAIELGCLELDEEDLALCTFVCPGKNDFGPHLRECLTTIEKEG